MGLHDREWFRNARNEQNEQSAFTRNSRKEPEITTKQREPWIKKMSAPPEYAVWAARYELAIRRRSKKTFAIGFFIGAITSVGLLWLFWTISI